MYAVPFWSIPCQSVFSHLLQSTLTNRLGHLELILDMYNNGVALVRFDKRTLASAQFSEQGHFTQLTWERAIDE
jgi:hypothetical protein